MAKKDNSQVQSQPKEKQLDREYNIFGLRRKPIVSSYNGAAETRRYLGRTAYYIRSGDIKDLSTFLNGSSATILSNFWLIS